LVGSNWLLLFVISSRPSTCHFEPPRSRLARNLVCIEEDFSPGYAVSK
jgi:hypothetical protein